MEDDPKFATSQIGNAWPQAALLASLANRLLPLDELGPGAHEAGATFLIDRQLLAAGSTICECLSTIVSSCGIE